MVRVKEGTFKDNLTPTKDHKFLKAKSKDSNISRWEKQLQLKVAQQRGLLWKVQRQKGSDMASIGIDS